MNLRASFLCLALGFSAVAFAQAEQCANEEKSCCKKEHLKSLDKKGIDSSISPKEDFYHHVNKGWMDSHPLTGEYSRYGQFRNVNTRL
ncbi:MAG: M13 family metallopeptidase [Muribaculaceae bacterium]|nr:M13 family metallopeptidase [Muribaculaceae bacterium]